MPAAARVGHVVVYVVEGDDCALSAIAEPKPDDRWQPRSQKDETDDRFCNQRHRQEGKQPRCDRQPSACRVQLFYEVPRATRDKLGRRSTGHVLEKHVGDRRRNVRRLPGPRYTWCDGAPRPCAAERGPVVNAVPSGANVVTARSGANSEPWNASTDANT
jgi:hypothetical protein